MTTMWQFGEWPFLAHLDPSRRSVWMKSDIVREIVSKLIEAILQGNNTRNRELLRNQSISFWSTFMDSLGCFTLLLIPAGLSEIKRAEAVGEVPWPENMIFEGCAVYHLPYLNPSD